LGVEGRGQEPTVPAPAIDLSHTGTPEHAWRDVVSSLPSWSLDPSRHLRVVVLAPHPDDETLGAGGLIAGAAEIGIDVVIVSLTDGEAAFVEVGLGERRHAELCDAVCRLVPGGGVSIVRCELPDGSLADCKDTIAAIINDHVRSGDLVLAPLHCDGHPDHDAVGQVAAAIDVPDVDVCLYPIWAWHWHQPTVSVIAVSGRRSPMTATAAAAKAAALLCYGSQTTGDAPILPTHFTGRFESPYELVVSVR